MTGGDVLTKARRKKKPGPKPGTGGRPQSIHIDWEKVKLMAQCHTGGETIANILGISYDSLARYCKKEHGMTFKEFYRMHEGAGKASLRQVQMNVALKGNPQMLVWLGKQYLGQKERNEISGDADNPLQITHAMVLDQINSLSNPQLEAGEDDPEEET